MGRYLDIIDLSEAHKRGFLIGRDGGCPAENAWRDKCYMAGIPSIVVRKYRRKAGLYIDPPSPMNPAVVSMLYPLFLRVAQGEKSLNSFYCGPNYCAITAARNEVISLAARAALILRNVSNVCPQRLWASA